MRAMASASAAWAALSGAEYPYPPKKWSTGWRKSSGLAKSTSEGTVKSVDFAAMVCSVASQTGWCQ